MEEWKINGGVLRFESETHTYWFNDQKCVSTTQVLKVLHKDKYKGVTSEILHKRAVHGTGVHNAIEMYETEGIANEDLQEFRDYLFIKKYYMFDVLAVELPVVIKYKGLIICGRLDGILMEPTDTDYWRKCLYDIKTTADLDMQYLSEQLSIYKYGVDQCYPEFKIDGLRAIHLKYSSYKHVRKYVVVDPVSVEDLLDRYLEIIEEEKENNEDL